MRPFLIGSQLPADPEDRPTEARVTNQGRVVTAMADGAWYTRRQLENACGLSTDAVNTVLQHGIRRGSVEREYARLRGATQDVTQRYRLAGK